METAIRPAADAIPSIKQQFLDTYDREHKTTMRVLRAYPKDKLELRPHPKCKTARELAWIFVMERGLGEAVFADAFASGGPSGEMPPPPQDWDELLNALEAAHKRFGDLFRATPEEELLGNVKFFTGPQTMGDVSRISFAWFMLSDEIHHRGQFSIYLRMADAKVPSIYGPTADEPWM